MVRPPNNEKKTNSWLRPCLGLQRQFFFSRPCLSTFFIKRKRITTTQLQENPRSAEIHTTKKVTSYPKQT